MILYRLTKTHYLTTVWTGYGAKEAGGSWSRIGIPMVYVSETTSLTLVETLVNLQAPQQFDTCQVLKPLMPDTGCRYDSAAG